MATILPAPMEDPIARGIRQMVQNFQVQGQKREQQKAMQSDAQLFQSLINPEMNELIARQRYAQGLPLLQGQSMYGESGPALVPGQMPAFQTPQMQNMYLQRLIQQSDLSYGLQQDLLRSQIAENTAQAENLSARSGVLGGGFGGTPDGLQVAGATVGPTGTSVRLERKPLSATPAIARQDDPSGLPEGTVYRDDPETGDRKIIFQPSGRELSNNEKITESNNLRKEFDSAQIKDDFETIKRSERGMEQAIRLSESPNVQSRVASDQALAVLFQKMLDPDSVVRESEYARTPEGIAAINQLTALPEKILKGGLKLESTDRQALKEMAEKLLAEAKISMNEHIDRFSQIADESGLNKKIIFGNIKKFDVGDKSLSVGGIVDRGGKKWKVVGFDSSGEPLVNEVK